MNNKKGLKSSFLCLLLTACLLPYATSFVTQNPLITNQTTVIEDLVKAEAFGYSVSGAGDINGDGFNDVIVSARNASPLQRYLAGIVYILFGSKQGIYNIDLQNLSSTQGFKILGAIAGNELGDSVSGAGDVNGDGIDDIIIGANYANPLGRLVAGTAYILFGKRQGLADLDLNNGLTPDQGIQIMGANAGDLTGMAVSGAGDVNGDGVDDVIIGAPAASPLNRRWAGVIYVIFGTYKGFSTIDLNALNSTQGFKLMGANAGDRIGYTVSGAGDVNGDGIDDVIVGTNLGSPLGRTYAGIAYVIFGSRNQFSDVDLSENLSTQGVKIMGANSEDYLGLSVSGAGDVNGDGIGDLIIGATQVTVDGKTIAGAAYVIFGKAGGFSDIDMKDFSNSQGFTITGAHKNDRFGSKVSSAGDVNGDGIDDMIIGAWCVNASNIYYSGAAYVIFGSRKGLSDVNVGNLSSSQGFAILGEYKGGQLGKSVSGAGDIDGNGIDDIIIGAPFVSEKVVNGGFVYIITFEAS